MSTWRTRLTELLDADHMPPVQADPEADEEICRGLYCFCKPFQALHARQAEEQERERRPKAA